MLRAMLPNGLHLKPDFHLSSFIMVTLGFFVFIMGMVILPLKIVLTLNMLMI
jgi:hypothetical protein